MRWNNGWKQGDLSDALNRRITIQEKTVTYNSYNEPIETWIDLKTVWAGIINTGGGEFYAAQKLYASTEVVFRIRYQNSISVENRINYDGTIHEILAINDVDGAHVEYQIAAKAVI